MARSVRLGLGIYCRDGFRCHREGGQRCAFGGGRTRCRRVELTMEYSVNSRLSASHGCGTDGPVPRILRSPLDFQR